MGSAERGNHGKPQRKPKIEVARILPTGVNFTSEGTKIEYIVAATSEKIAEDAIKRFGLEKAEPPKKNSSKSFGMPGSRWNALWEPQGPNLSWQKPLDN